MKTALLITFSSLAFALQAQQAVGDLATASGIVQASVEEAEQPFELVSFVAQAAGEKNIHVRWTTLHERPNEHFILERSGDLERWEIISQLNGGGPSQDLSGYEVDDEAPLPGVSYYRLLNLSNGITSELSDLFSVSRPIEQVLLIHAGASPGHFAVSAHGSLSDVRLMNNRGQFVTMAFDVRNDEVLVNAELLEPGTYYIQANVDGTPVLRPVIITSSTVIGG